MELNRRSLPLVSLVILPVTILQHRQPECPPAGSLRYTYGRFPEARTFGRKQPGNGAAIVNGRDFERPRQLIVASYLFTETSEAL